MLPARGPRGSAAPQRSMWVWSSAQLLGNDARQAELFAFSRAHGVGVLWMQITTRTAGGTAATPRLAVSRIAEWRRLIAAARAQGLSVEALDGDPTYADRRFHGIALAIVEAVLAYNRDSPPESRFDGLHFDNEPYLLPGWRDRATRERLLVEYLTLNDEIQRRVRAVRGMRYGVDVPFWWHAIDGRTGEATAAVTYDGRRQSASLHAVERLDEVTVMDYRNDAEGPDGLVAHASPLLTDASASARGRVRIGVETSRFAPARIWMAISRIDTADALTPGEGQRRAFAGDGARLRTVDDGRRIHLGVEIPVGGGAAPPAALVAVARRLAETQDIGGATEAITRALGGDPEWRDLLPAPIRDPVTQMVYAGLAATYTPLAKVTFATRPEAMESEMAIATRVFREFPPYAGIAVHHYDAYRALTAVRTGGAQ